MPFPNPSATDNLIIFVCQELFSILLWDLLGQPCGTFSLRTYFCSTSSWAATHLWVPLDGRFQGHQPDWAERERQKAVGWWTTRAVAGSKVQSWGGWSKPKEEEPYFTSQQGVGTLNVVRGGCPGEGWHNMSTTDQAAAIEKYSASAWNHVRYCCNFFRTKK